MGQAKAARRCFCSCCFERWLRPHLARGLTQSWAGLWLWVPWNGLPGKRRCMAKCLALARSRPSAKCRNGLQCPRQKLVLSSSMPPRLDPSLALPNCLSSVVPLPDSRPSCHAGLLSALQPVAVSCRGISTHGFLSPRRCSLHAAQLAPSPHSVSLRVASAHYPIRSSCAQP